MLIPYRSVTTPLLLTFTIYLAPFCFAEEETDIVSFDNQPIALIGGMVNAITGTFQIHACDLVIAGSEPLVLTRSYISGGHSYGALCQGWHFNHQGKIYFNREKKYYRNRVFTGPSGETLLSTRSCHIAYLRIPIDGK